MSIVALVTDLMDRSRLDGLADRYVRTAAALDEQMALAERVEAVIVDLARPDAIEAIRSAASRGVRVVAYGSHVDTATLDDAAAAGATAMPRSRFFQDPRAALSTRHSD